MKFFTLFTALVVFNFGFSQTCSNTFLGQLSDFHDNTPIVGATIYIKNLDKYTTSDKDGKFKIEKLCDGNLTLTISHVACKTKTVSFPISGDVFKSIVLEHHIEALGEVSITGVAQKTETKTGQETVLKQNILKRYSSLSIGDALKEVPGVSSINTGNTIVKPMINGLYGSRLLILNNDVRLQDQEWGIEHAPNIDINSTNQISVIKGAAALAYGGDAVGGVIVLNPQRVLLKDTLFGKTTLSGQTNGRGFSVSSSLNKMFETGWYASLQGAVKKNGDFEAPDYVLSNTGLESQSFTVQGGKKTFESGFEVFYSYINTEIGILSASHLGNITDLVNAINAPRPLFIEDFTYGINQPKQDVTHQLAKIAYYKRFKNFGKVSLQYDYQNNRRFEFDIRVGDDRDKAALDLELQTHSFTADFNMDSNLDRKINFGVLARYQNNFANPDTGVRRLIPDYDKYDFGGYATTEWLLNDNTTVDAGFRYDFNRIDAKKFYRTSRWEERGYDQDFGDLVIGDFGNQLLVNPIFDYHNFSASAGIRYELNGNSYLIGNYSLSSRPPNPSELFSDGLHHSAARIEIGDLRLNQEISNRISASYNLSTSKFNLNVEAFYNSVKDFIYLRPFGEDQTIRGAFPVWDYRQTDANLFGIDVSAKYQITERFDFANASAFIKGKDVTEDRPLIDIPAFNTTNTLSYRHESWHNFSMSLKSEWVFEQNEFPDFNFETTLPTTNERVLVDISTPPPAFHLLHFYSEMTFDVFKNSKLNVALNVTNILDTTYRTYLNRLRFFADDLGRNISLQLQLTY